MTRRAKGGFVVRWDGLQTHPTWTGCKPILREAPAVMQRDFGKFAEQLQALLPWVIVLTVTIAVMAVGVYWLGKYWGRAGEDHEGPAGRLTMFREMHERGELSDAEFRTIKTQLAGQMQAKVSDSDETG